jgi:hypothetical protein
MLAELPSRRGICSAHLFERAAAAAMTNEQRIRGADADMDCAILITGYDESTIAALDALVPKSGHSANLLDAAYRVAHSLSAAEPSQ